MDRDEYERTDPERRDRSTGRGGTGKKNYSEELERFFVEGSDVHGWRVHRIVSCTKRKITAQCSYTIWGNEDKAVKYAEILSGALDVATWNMFHLDNDEEDHRSIVVKYLSHHLTVWGLRANDAHDLALMTVPLLLMTVCLDLSLPIPKTLREALAESLGFFYGK